ncbi:MAG: T9SS type A sorting domain-containing protein [bacterium]|nr:T9SS type A sorting domain-containing protein [bacterium]
MVQLIAIIAVFSVSAGAVYIPQPPDATSEMEMKCSRYREYVAEHGTIGATKAYHNYDVQKYTIDIYIDDVAEYITATTTVNLDIAENGVTRIELDLDDVSLTVNQCRVNGTPRSFTHASELLTVNLGGTYNIGANIDIAVDYEGSPSWGLYFDDEYGGRCWTQTETSETSSFWYPCYNLCSDKADGGVELFIDVRGDWEVASNGLLVGTSTPAPGRKEYHWLHQYPIAMYLISLDATDMYFYEDAWDGIPLRVWSYESQSGIDDLFDMYKLQLDGFKYRCGNYPFSNEKVGICDTGSGGMEHQTISNFNPIDLGWLSAHEQGHQWWGDCVTCETFDNMWLNEGFATYCEMFYHEDASGMNIVRSHMDDKRDSIIMWSWTKRTPIYPLGMDGLVYYKGAWVLHMMRNEMDSDTQFYDALKYYRSQHDYGTATTPEFQSDVEAFTGEDWDWFFYEWVYMAGYPEIEWYWTNTGDNEVTIHVEQVQDIITFPLVPIFEMHIDFGLTTDNGEEIHTVWMPDEEETFILTASEPVTDVEFDPNVWLLYKDMNESAVEMTSFTATPVRNGIKLEWETEEEYGDVSYNLYREEVSGELANTKRIMLNDEPIVGESPYVFVDRNITANTKYDYWLEVIEPNSPVQNFGPASATAPVLVKAFELMQNRPNPATGITTFAFALPEAAKTTLSIYDIKGRKVDTVIEGNLAAGQHSIDYACALPGGIYLYRLEAGGESAVKKMVVE